MSNILETFETCQQNPTGCWYIGVECLLPIVGDRNFIKNGQTFWHFHNFHPLIMILNVWRILGLWSSMELQTQWSGPDKSKLVLNSAGIGSLKLWHDPGNFPIWSVERTPFAGWPFCSNSDSELAWFCYWPQPVASVQHSIFRNTLVVTVLSWRITAVRLTNFYGS